MDAVPSPKYPLEWVVTAMSIVCPFAPQTPPQTMPALVGGVRLCDAGVGSSGSPRTIVMNTSTEILLVEDDPDDAFLTADLFAEMGDFHHTLSWVDNYESGMERLLHDPPALCLLDFHLGARNGLELLREVTARGCSAPIVFLTGQAERGLDLEAMKEGAAGYLIKGQFEAKQLERTIRYAIERSRAAAERQQQDRAEADAQRALVVERLTDAVESIPQALALFGADDRLVECNEAYRRLLGGSRSPPSAGTPYAEILVAWSHALEFHDDVTRVRECTAWVARRWTNDATLEVCTHDGRTLRASARRTPSGGLIEIIWDITADAHREDELRRARQAADEANAAKSSFLASVSHELRTPLNAILGFSRLLQRERLTLEPRHREWVEQIQSGGEHLLRLINDVLDLSHVESGSFAPSLTAVRLSDLLTRVAGAIGPMATGMSLAVTRTPVPDELDWVLADSTRLLQILMNFATNAAKYNVTGGRLEFGVQALSPGRIRVSVADTGIGIPVARQAEVFQPFQRAGQETGPIEGTGIGLALSKRLANLMHGSVGFHSEPGVGSTFWVELPEHPDPPRPAPIAPAPASPPLVNGHSDRQLVLYIEDNPANTLFMLALLDSFDGVDSLAAETGAEGVALARARRPAVIIVDINLPDMTGFEVLCHLREHPETAKIPVVALSAAAFAGDRERGEQTGFFRYLTKPVNIEELETTLVHLGLLASTA